MADRPVRQESQNANLVIYIASVSGRKDVSLCSIPPGSKIGSNIFMRNNKINRLKVNLFSFAPFTLTAKETQWYQSTDKLEPTIEVYLL